MKLRIKGNSLRMRLTRREVRELDERGEVADQIEFGGQAALVYRVRRDAVATALTATYTSGIIEICVPEQTARTWCNTDAVSLEHARPTAEGALQILVEKDFSCLVPREGEDESDHFPHPQAAPQREP